MSTSLIEEQDSLEFKADFFPMTVIKLANTNLDAIKSQISATIVAVPNYFKNAPVVIDIMAINPSDKTIDLEAICEILRLQSMIPVGVRCPEPLTSDLKIPTGLALMKAPKSKEKKAQPSLTSGNPSDTRKIEKPKAAPTTINTKLRTTPIRSGTQIYARDSDLVVTAPVNPGGECFADGNIHIYGPLRGKALAGASGNESARIFCESLEAELIAIAGHYLTSDQIDKPKTNKPMIQIYLKDGKIHIDGV